MDARLGTPTEAVSDAGVDRFTELAGRLEAWFGLLYLDRPDRAEEEHETRRAMREARASIGNDPRGTWYRFHDGLATWVSESGDQGRSFRTLPADAPAERVLEISIPEGAAPLQGHCRRLLNLLRESGRTAEDAEVVQLNERRLECLRPGVRVGFAAEVYAGLASASISAAGVHALGMAAPGRPDPSLSVLPIRRATAEFRDWAVDLRRQLLLDGSAVAALTAVDAIVAELNEDGWADILGEFNKLGPLSQSAAKPLVDDQLLSLIQLAGESGHRDLLQRAADALTESVDAEVKSALGSASITEFRWAIYRLCPRAHAALRLLQACDPGEQGDSPSLRKKIRYLGEVKARLITSAIRHFDPRRKPDEKARDLQLVQLVGGDQAVEEKITELVDLHWMYPTVAKDWLRDLARGGVR